MSSIWGSGTAQWGSGTDVRTQDLRRTLPAPGHR